MQAIAAVDQNWGIGKDGDQLCYIRADLKRFKTLTTGHPVILGRKTLATFPGGKPLPGRRNLILTRSREFRVEGGEVYHDLDSLLAQAPADSFVIGGASVYRSLLKCCETVYITKIMSTFEADAFFPNLDELPEWEAVKEEEIQEENGLKFRYVTYKRK